MPRFKTEFSNKIFKQDIHYSTLKAWNDVPATILVIPDRNSFKNRSKHILWTGMEIEKRILGITAFLLSYYYCHHR